MDCVKITNQSIWHVLFSKNQSLEYYLDHLLYLALKSIILSESSKCLHLGDLQRKTKIEWVTKHLTGNVCIAVYRVPLVGSPVKPVCANFESSSLLATVDGFYMAFSRI